MEHTLYPNATELSPGYPQKLDYEWDTLGYGLWIRFQYRYHLWGLAFREWNYYIFAFFYNSWAILFPF